MTTPINVNISDEEIENLTGPEIKAHIAALTGLGEKKIATRQDGLKTLRRLRQWSRNQDGLLGVPKDGKAQVRSMFDLAVKARSKGKALEPLPKANERVSPIDPEWEDPADIVDGNDALEIMPENEPASAPEIIAEMPEVPEAPQGVIADRDQAEATDSPATRKYPRGSLREKLAAQAAAAAPIAAKPSPSRVPKKITGEPRKPREALLGVKATFAGATKNHKGGVRENVLNFIQSKATRTLEGWPMGSVPVTEIDDYFAQNMKPIVHKLLEDGHLARAWPKGLEPKA